MQARLRHTAMVCGATLVAPETVTLSADTILAPDVTVHPHVVFGPGVTVGEGAEIKAFTHLEGAHIAAGAEVGPYARLRPGAEVGERARVGNFVEVKNATLHAGAKANHLTYLGDAEVGEGANIGAGTITCNYDGIRKARTTIGAGAFIGSNTALVAPVTIGAGAMVGAGSTITQDVPADGLGLARAPQSNRPEVARRFREARAAREPDDES
jgi:bifunctional UDP-N-acetylglucosamine pyrophosphorylase/glucosamine-1-phosphate N-acetyltransferase